MAKKILKGVGILLIAVIAFVLYLTVTEYKPEAVEEVDVRDWNYNAGPSFELLHAIGDPIAVGDSITLASLNTGYAGLDERADFFMDGGDGVKPSKEQSKENLMNLIGTIRGLTADVYFLQEVDTDSSRSYSVDQAHMYHTLSGSQTSPKDGLFSAHTLNYSCSFVPYPWPPIGKVHSGVQTLSSFTISKAERIALPCPFKWPVSAANLKRCLLVSYVPLDNSDKQLVLVNLHLEAYDDGEGKAAQTKMLMEFLTSEYEKGNYVIAGGDFNQTFPGALDAFPIKDADLWTPGVLEDAILPEGWQFAYDLTTPSCRLLNEPYDPDSENTQFYVIDGFILSPNVELNAVETLNAQFEYTDHNPVRLEVTLSE